MAAEISADLVQVGVVPEGFESLKEGSATVIHKGKNEVFYNPAQVANRDLSIAVLKWFIAKREEEFRAGAA